MSRKPETVDDHVWAGLFNAGEMLVPRGRGLIAKMRYTKQWSREKVLEALEAAEKADDAQSYLGGCMRGEKSNGSVLRPRPSWAASEDATHYFGLMDKNGERRKLEKAERV